MLVNSERVNVLLTGVTGYVGGRLLESLIAEQCHVRCLVRDAARFEHHDVDNVEVVEADVLDDDSLFGKFDGVDVAYYLIHSMGSANDFAEQDRQAATNFAKHAAAAGVKKVIYLGGLGNPNNQLSKHLASRQETGQLLRALHPNVIEFRASIVIGSGSLSFELIRALVERLPIMICPKWVEVQAQPISIEDLLQYLVAALRLPNSGSQVYEIGGPEQVSYGDIMREYAFQRGLQRWMIPVPLLTPHLSSLWLGLVTPLYARVGRKIVDSLRNPTIVKDDSALRIFHIQPRTVAQAIARALENEDRQFAQTRWSDALSSSGNQVVWGGERFGSRLVDHRTVTVPCSVAHAFEPIKRIGGKTGWYYANWLWTIRGFIDLLFGGVGVRRGRKDPAQLRIGDAIDFWRVEAYRPSQHLRLKAEMRLPGRAWLEFNVTTAASRTVISQTATFDPIGLGGLAYWYLVYPLHQFVFAGMLRNIGKAALQNAPTEGDSSSNTKLSA